MHSGHDQEKRMLTGGDDAPPSHVLRRFRLSSPEFAARTGIATVWRARNADGADVALKVYHGADMRNEAAGFAILDALAGRSAAQVFAISEGAAVIEWLPGPSLGDLTRNGRDAEAAAHLVAVAADIHCAPIRTTTSLPTLNEWYAALFDLRFADTCDGADRHLMQMARHVARELLASEEDIRPLHGDLHHDNIRLGARGWCAFDAKGVVGERCYELANAMRNPTGAEALAADPARIRLLRDHWSAGFDVAPGRLMRWAVAKTGLSMAWRADGAFTTDPDLPILAALCDVAGL